MASFQAKIVWKRPRKIENKNYRVVTFLLDALQKIPKQQQKKKIINSIMASFQAKIVWKRQRKREYKNYSFVPSLPDAQFKIPKKLQKYSKN